LGEEAGEDGGRDLDTRGERKRVAIACQGGGSHTAFTAGVLKRLLRAEELKRHEVVGLSGTSGGAVCALLAWHYLLRGEGARAAEALDAFWRDNSATAPHEQMVNHWIVWASNLQNFVTMPAISPYDNYFSGFALDEFRRMLERRMHFEKIPALRLYEKSQLGPDEVLWAHDNRPQKLRFSPLGGSTTAA
jgi:NTE family protein